MTVNIDTVSVFRPRPPIVGPEYNHHPALTPPDRVTITQLLSYTFRPGLAFLAVRQKKT